MDKLKNFNSDTYGFKEFSEEDIILTKLDPSVVSTIYFRSSWIIYREFELEEFDKKINSLILKDKDSDSQWLPVTHIIAFNMRTNLLYLIEIAQFRDLLKNPEKRKILKDIFGWEVDYYLPRSVWWKSFLLLERELELTDYKKYLYR